MTSNEINGRTAFMDGFAGRLKPHTIQAAETAAQAIPQSAQPCGEATLCAPFTGSVNAAISQFSQFFAQVKEGYGEYSTIASTSADDYRRRDGVGRNEIARALDLQPGELRTRMDAPPEIAPDVDVSPDPEPGAAAPAEPEPDPSPAPPSRPRLIK
ncbi:hypothetical protein OHR68_20615 [Spirillospora sp. NBC_00431]